MMGYHDGTQNCMIEKYGILAFKWRVVSIFSIPRSKVISKNQRVMVKFAGLYICLVCGKTYAWYSQGAVYEITISGHCIVGNESYNITFHFSKDTDWNFKFEREIFKFLNSYQKIIEKWALFWAKIKILKIFVSNWKFHSVSLGKWKGVL